MRQLLLALWAGTLVGVGALAAPSLFAALEDRALAGRVAGELFHRTALVSLLLALALMLVDAGRRTARRRFGPLWPIWPLRPLAPALLLFANDALLQPLIAAARAAGGAASRSFIAWHAASVLLYLTATALTIALLVAELRQRP